ncbi:MAG: MBL fold metallo-hydrolase, partial [Solirubrobacterales bacterium]
LLTHIHLDHAGVTGALVERFPGLEVCVHERGAPHVIDPSKLVRSAERLYGEDMQRLWGRIVPVPEANVRVLGGGEVLDGDIEVAYTPGHASHHVNYFAGEVAFAGDVAGVRIPPSAYVMPPTPPPDIDLERWRESLDLLEARAPRRIAITHFGSVDDDIGAHLAALRERMDAWESEAQALDAEAFEQARFEEFDREAPEVAEVLAQASPPYTLYGGLARYLDKREG